MVYKYRVAEFNKPVNIAKSCTQSGLKCSGVGTLKLKLRTYADATFASNDGLFSQLGFLTILTDKYRKVQGLEYWSKKSSLNFVW